MVSVSERNSVNCLPLCLPSRRKTHFLPTRRAVPPKSVRLFRRKHTCFFPIRRVLFGPKKRFTNVNSRHFSGSLCCKVLTITCVVFRSKIACLQPRRSLAANAPFSEAKNSEFPRQIHASDMAAQTCTSEARPLLHDSNHSRQKQGRNENNSPFIVRMW